MKKKVYCLTGDKEPKDGSKEAESLMMYKKSKRNDTKSQQAEENIDNGQPGDEPYNHPSRCWFLRFFLSILVV